jgi:hypothetical protein
MNRRSWLIALFTAAVAPAAESGARKKLNRVQDDAAPAGWLNFSSKEVNQLAAEEVALQYPQGVRNPHVDLGENSAIGSARIDFAAVRAAASGEAPGALARLLLGGEKDVAVETVFRSSNGTVQIDPIRVSINGFEIKGFLLEWLVENYLLPLYPDAKIGKPFEIGFHVQEVQVTPSRVRLRIVR